MGLAGGVDLIAGVAATSLTPLGICPMPLIVLSIPQMVVIWLRLASI